MLRPFLFLFLMFGAWNGFAQGIDTDSTHHYLILRSKSPAYHSRIFKESKRLTLQHRNGKSFTGRLYFINDSTVQLINIVKLKSDTFALTDIAKLKNSTLIAGVIGYTGMAAGVGMLAGGVALIADGSSYGDELETSVGVVLTVAGIFYTIIGKSMTKGKQLHLYDYDLKQHTSKGYELKHKHLKFLFPRNNRL